MIDVDLRRYGNDKDYENAVNRFLNNKNESFDCKFDEESLEKLKNLCGIPEDIEHKIIDIYNYMAKEKASKIELQFEDGIKVSCKIDDSEWKDRPVINLEDAVKGELE